MAEGLLRGVLGGEEEEQAASAKAAPEAFAAAVAANVANHSPEVAAETAVFLRKQTELLEAQRKTVEAEHEYFERAGMATASARRAAADRIPGLHRARRDRYWGWRCGDDPRRRHLTARGHRAV